jgi:hypothetical protein
MDFHEVLPLPPPLLENHSRHHESQEADQEGTWDHRCTQAASLVVKSEAEV